VTRPSWRTRRRCSASWRRASTATTGKGRSLSPARARAAGMAA
jgi:hypothetical protein